jgi:enoyl-CoA hydratase
MGLVNRVVPVGQARVEAEALAHQLAALPQTCLRRDRLSLLDSEGLTEAEALAAEYEHGLVSLTEAVEGAQRFASGAGRHGEPA